MSLYISTNIYTFPIGYYGYSTILQSSLQSQSIPIHWYPEPRTLSSDPNIVPTAIVSIVSKDSESKVNP